MNTPQDRWYPVARADDLSMRHVFHGQLQGVELALWRADDGQVNAWENRCPHRSVRLSLGANTGQTLRCQYHGWQYHSGDGRCVYIPASKDSTPPRSLCTRTFAVTETQGYVWVNLNAAHAATFTPPSASLACLLRSLVFHANIETVADALMHYASDEANTDASPPQWVRRGDEITGTWVSAAGAQHACFWLQPVNETRTIVHGSAQADGITEQALLHEHNRRLSALRRQVESGDSVTGSAVSTQGFVKPRVIPIASSEVPRSTLLTVTVAERWATAEDITAFRLALPPGTMLNFEPGAHIDVHTPAGVVRQYSLVNAPHERDALVIGTKLESASRGGSRSMQHALKAGDRLTVSWPKNHFRLVPNTPGLLIAGGIGVTPLLSMAAALQAAGMDYALHYFARSAAHLAFGDRLAQLHNLHRQTDLSVEATQVAVDAALRAAPDGCHVYVCGPRPLIDWVRTRAAAIGIAEQRVHFELFANEVSHDTDTPFRVRLAKRGVEFLVPAGVTLTDMLKAQGVAIETSCEQGVCGTCRTAVLEGAPEHRDVYLTDEEKRGQRCLLPCVSRSRSELLVLDL